MTNYKHAKAYAAELANSLKKITLADFFDDVHTRFYPEQDVSFMMYFLEIAEHQGEFVVHHSKLREYGVVTTTDASRIKDKLAALDLVEGVNYVVEDVLVQHSSGSKHIKEYHLTPEAFKMCLVRAQRWPNQPIDPVIYVRYYLFLETIFGLFEMYEQMYFMKLLSTKDSKIDMLLADSSQQTALITNFVTENKKQVTTINKLIAVGKNQTTTITDQSRDITKLLGYARTVKSTLRSVQIDLATTTEDLATATEDLATVRGDLATVTEDLAVVREDFSTVSEDLATINDELVETKQEVMIVKSQLEQKSFCSTMNPADASKHHYFAATMIQHGQIRVVKFVTGQKFYVDRIITQREAEGHTVVIQPFYNANGVDLRHNAQQEFRKRRDAIIKELNDANAHADKIYNKSLKAVIKAHNLMATKQGTAHRKFSNEKKVTPLLRKADVTVTFSKLTFTYTPNKFMSFKDVIGILKDVNKITQNSPLPPTSIKKSPKYNVRAD